MSSELVQNCHIPEISNFLKSRIPRLEESSIKLKIKKKLVYGMQLEIGDREGLINIYYSAKKGVSVVDCSRTPASKKLVFILMNNTEKGRHDIYKEEGRFNSWIGTDESGKGDFFGPLVVAGFIADRKRTVELESMGVRDSKTIDSRGIAELAQAINKTWPRRCCVLCLENQRYNVMYGDMESNMNNILGWAHGYIINELAGKYSVEGAVVDQFGSERYLETHLADISFPVIQRAGAEDNPAVAAASVLARNCFQEKVAEMGLSYGMNFPFGAGQEVIKTARLFAAENGKKELIKVAKVHFKTFNSL
jgi:ribonuclease HIII